MYQSHQNLPSENTKLVAPDGGNKLFVDGCANRNSVFTTNSPSLPFNWTDTNTGSLPMQFYRVLMARPFRE